jgi:hypothetical protein
MRVKERGNVLDPNSPLQVGLGIHETRKTDCFQSWQNRTNRGLANPQNGTKGTRPCRGILTADFLISGALIAASHLAVK